MRAKFFITGLLLALAVPAAGDAQAARGLVSPANQAERIATTEPNATSDTDENSIVSDEDGVAALVNDAPITTVQLRQRMALFVSTSGLQATPEVLKKIRSQILQQLVTEKLQIEEARRKSITVSSPEVDKAIDRIVSDNHLNLEQLKSMLAKNGVVFQTLRDQIASQLVWQKTVEDEFQDRINITQQDIDAELARLSVGASKTHYLVSVIFLPVDTPDQDAKVLKDIQDLRSQLELGAPFQAVARQFSQSPSAAAGGDIGWVYDGQLAPELNQTLGKLTPGGTSDPVRSTGGYYILNLRERQEPAGTKVPEITQDTAPKESLPLERVLLALGPHPSQDMTEGAMKLAGEISQRVVACANLDKIAAQIRGAQFMNLGEMKLKDMSQEMQGALARTEPGQVATPFLSAAGVEIIARCDKPVPKITAMHMPSRAEVEEQLFDQQVTAFARRYLRNLRRQADVETR